MQILHLLEAEAYRYQAEWESKTDPVLHVPGRVSRRSASASYEAYGLALGMELNNVQCPRRWKSTFATTNPNKSHYMSIEGRPEGMRRLEIPKGVKIAAVVDDFNMHESFSSVLYIGYKAMCKIQEAINEKLQSDPTNQDLKNLHAKVKLWGDGFSTLFLEESSDVGYDWFKELVEEFDEIIQLDIVDSQLIPEQILGFGTLKGALQNQIENILDVQKVQVFNSIDDVPNATGLEIWFEGDYEAHLLTHDEKIAFSTK